ncbi:MAG: 2-iminoacetate synthase ThiH [Blastochloris sp.]|nr:2-iminoacetate synthase ThiH [Blastochloris sp.]
MSFLEVFNRLPEEHSPRLRRFSAMLDSSFNLEELAQEAEQLTRQNFGKTMRLFAPLYLSNECVNVCKYCGFSRDNPILRVTLALDQVEAESRYLVAEGFRNILLVAGEHPKFVSEKYLEDCIERIHPFVPSVSLEVGPMETEEYIPLVQAGAEGLVVYQETYDRAAYAELHVAGPKKNFDWRLACPERAYAAGFRRIGIGALFGLSDWRREALALAAHAEYLLKHCWKSSLTISFPRLRPAAGEFEPRVVLSDRELVRMICAFRVSFPQIGLVLSTREPAALRDGLIPLGVTLMSAGSHTEPGGYTRVGQEKLHRTEKGKMVPLIDSEGEFATEQFAISDQRSAGVMVAKLKELGFDPVWKDWDGALGGV